jgi:excisionase family DNA binding protein
LLTAQQAAAELGVDVLTVNRLIVRDRLQAARIGKEYRIAASELTAFVARGAPDAALPPVDRGWLASNSFRRDGFASQLMSAALATQRLSDADVQQRAQQSRDSSPTIQVQLSVTPSMRRVFNAPPAESTGSARTREQFATAGQEYLVYVLRDVTARAAGGMPLSPAKLYSDQETYMAATRKGLGALTTRSLRDVEHRQFTVTTRAGTMAPETTEKRSATVVYSLKLADLMPTSNDVGDVWEKAF